MEITYFYILHIIDYVLIIKVIIRRRPAWTDRILYKHIPPSNKNCTLDVLSYKHIESLKLSDHKPVYGESIIQVIIKFEQLITILINILKFSTDM